MWKSRSNKQDTYFGPWDPRRPPREYGWDESEPIKAQSVSHRHLIWGGSDLTHDPAVTAAIELVGHRSGELTAAVIEGSRVTQFAIDASPDNRVCREHPMTESSALALASLEFLLKRTQSSELNRSFRLDDIEQVFPDYPAVMGRLFP